MTVTGRNAPRRRTRAIGITVFLFGAWGGPAMAALSVGSDVGIMGAWTDNLNLAPPGEPKESGEFWQLTPGLHLQYDTRFEQSRLQYELHALEFSNGQHEVFHRGELFSETRIVPDWFYLDLAGERDQSVVTPSSPVGLDALYPINNLANVTTASLRPILRHKFRLFSIDASYARGTVLQQAVSNGNDLVPNSDERDASATLSSVDPNNSFTWSANYLSQRVDFGTVPSSSQLVTPAFGYLPYRYERASAEVGLRVISSIRLLARGGKESNPYEGVSEGGFGSTFWSGGIDWKPDRLNELRLLVGRRFYGTSYDALWQHQTRLLNLQVSYTEQPTTEESMIQSAPLGPVPTVYVPGTPTFIRVSPDIFLQKLLTAAVTITGRLTDIGVSITSDQQSYFTTSGSAPGQIAPGAEDRDRSATVYATRRIGPLTSLTVSGTIDRMELREGDQFRFTSRRYSAVLSRQIGKRASLRLAANHIQQTGAIQDFNANIVTLSVDMSFGAPANSVQGIGIGSPSGTSQGVFPGGSYPGSGINP